MGTPTILGKITTGVAIVFAITSFTLALLGGERGSSVVREPAPRRPPLRAALRTRAAAAPAPGPASARQVTCADRGPAVVRASACLLARGLRPAPAVAARSASACEERDRPRGDTPAYGDTLVEAIHRQRLRA